MTDNEIIKALECLGGVSTVCKECAYDSREYPWCKEKAARDAIDLINRQQAEKEALIAGQETLQKVLAEKNAEIERLKERDEKYPFKCVMPFNSMICSMSIEDYDRLISDIGADAIKEFAERLKEIYRTHEGLEYEIDNLVKEMTEPSLLDKKFGGDTE